MKALASLVVGVLLPPVDWQKRFEGRRDDERLPEEVVRKLVLEECAFEYVTHAVKAGSLYTARSTTVATSVEARSAAAALANTPGSRSASIDDHEEYRAEFTKQFDVLVCDDLLLFR